MSAGSSTQQQTPMPPKAKVDEDMVDDPVQQANAARDKSKPPPSKFENLVDELAKEAIAIYKLRKPSHRLLVAVYGIPGAGKTYLTQHVVRRINILTQLEYGTAIAAVIPMDGFHLTRAELDKMPDPQLAHKRRGAPFTFDADGLKALILALKVPVETFKLTDEDTGTYNRVIYAPSFDHAVKDPVPKNITILPSQKIILLEGNYLGFKPPLAAPGSISSSSDHHTHPSPIWSEIPQLFDIRWFVDTPQRIAAERLAKRHLEAGIVQTLEEGYERANGSDAQNAADITKWKAEKCDRVIEGLPPKEANEQEEKIDNVL